MVGSAFYAFAAFVNGLPLVLHRRSMSVLVLNHNVKGS